MKKKTITFAFVALLVVMLIAINAQPGLAYWLRVDRDNATFTAYAMGGGGAGQSYTGHALRSGDAAVHRQSNGQPVIPYGTYLYLKSYSVAIPNGSTGGTDNFSSLIVNDNGGGTGNEYWVDVYFGRWRRSSDACTCPGVSNSQCTVGSTNSCTNAINYGTSTHSFYYYRWVN